MSSASEQAEGAFPPDELEEQAEREMTIALTPPQLALLVAAVAVVVWRWRHRRSGR